MANSYYSRICQSCQNDGFEYHYKCLLQQKYTDLEQKLDSKNGLISQMFQRRIISFSEKKSFEGMANNCKRNREIIDLFFENRTPVHYLSFLDCLKASGQSQILDYLNCEENISKSVESKVSVTNSDHCEEGEFQFVGKITLEDKLAVMGLCYMDGSICAICHMDPHVFIFLAKPPFIPQPFREFDLPVEKDQFHFYDMLCCEEEGILVVSDKANRCLWLADVNKKQTSKFEVTDGSPLRMSLSSYVPICSDDEGYEDIYGGNCKDFEGSFDSSVENDANKLVAGSFDPEKLVEQLLVEKISFVDEKIQNEKVSSGRIALKADKKNIIVVVQNEGQYCLNFYSNTSKMKFLRRIPLMIGKEFSTSNAVQRKCDGHIFICYGDVDYGNKDNSPWYLGEYSPDGELLRSYLSQPKVWNPRYIASDDVDTKVVYAVGRFSGEIMKLKCIPNDQVLNISSLSTNKHQLTMPSRHRFCRERRDDGKEALILLVGQGEIKKPRPSASIVVLKKYL